MFRSLFLLFTLSLASCGYTLRGNTRPIFEKQQIKTIYITPVKNNSYKAGAEIPVYNAIRKRISEGGYVQIVDSAAMADATFTAIVYSTGYTPGYPTTANTLYDGTGKQGGDSGVPPVQVATIYNAYLKVAFELRLVRQNKVLWKDELIRNKNFAATTYLGTLGSTSALINDSDYERTLIDLSQTIVVDAEESINTIL